MLRGRRCCDRALHFLLAPLLRSQLGAHYPHMSGEVKLCPKCNKTTLEPTLNCVVPPEMLRLLQKPISNGGDPRVTPYFCLSCHCVTLYPMGA
jgi:hypothetical protein